MQSVICDTSNTVVKLSAFKILEPTAWICAFLAVIVELILVVAYIPVPITLFVATINIYVVLVFSIGVYSIFVGYMAVLEYLYRNNDLYSHCKYRYIDRAELGLQRMRLLTLTILLFGTLSMVDKLHTYTYETFPKIASSVKEYVDYNKLNYDNKRKMIHAYHTAIENTNEKNYSDLVIIFENRILMNK